MEEEKGFLHGFIQLVKYTLVAILAWFVVGAGWNGWYEFYSREVLGKVPNEGAGEKFGNKVFVGWFIFTILAIIAFSQTSYPELIFKLFLIISIIFVNLTLIGLIYFFTKCF